MTDEIKQIREQADEIMCEARNYKSSKPRGMARIMGAAAGIRTMCNRAEEKHAELEREIEALQDEITDRTETQHQAQHQAHLARQREVEAARRREL